MTHVIPVLMRSLRYVVSRVVLHPTLYRQHQDRGSEDGHLQRPPTGGEPTDHYMCIEA